MPGMGEDCQYYIFEAPVERLFLQSFEITRMNF